MSFATIFARAARKSVLQDELRENRQLRAAIERQTQTARRENMSEFQPTGFQPVFFQTGEVLSWTGPSRPIFARIFESALDFSMRRLVRPISRLAIALILLVLLATLHWSLPPLAAQQPVVDPKALPKFPPVSASEALGTFQLKKGFRLELVAAEPLVTDPIALAFDEDGRLFVVEMNDYPERGEQHLGQIKRLEDSDGDGRFDKSTVFAKNLRWPAAIFRYGGGLFVGSTPDLLYFKDTDGDGVADEKQVVLTGWGSRAGKLEAEGAFNSLTWGLDNRIHGLCNRDSGVITNPTNPAAK